MTTILTIECMFCGRLMGEKDGMGCTGITSSVCLDCARKHYPDFADEFLSEYPC